MANYKAQKDCLKTMLPLQTPLGQQARLLYPLSTALGIRLPSISHSLLSHAPIPKYRLRKHDPASDLARRYPEEGGSDLHERVYDEDGEMAHPDYAPFSNEPPYASSVSSALYATNRPAPSRGDEDDTMPHHRQSPRDKESHQTDHDNAPSSTAAMRKAQLERAQSRRRLAEAEAKNDAHGIDGHESEIDANTFPSVVPVRTFPPSFRLYASVQTALRLYRGGPCAGSGVCSAADAPWRADGGIIRGSAEKEGQGGPRAKESARARQQIAGQLRRMIRHVRACVV